MNFFKNFGIYGIVPVISKSMGFFLVPLYTKYLDVTEFGYQDIFTVFSSLMVFFVALEIHSGVGRYFYEGSDLNDKRRLISTAFTFQLLTGITVVIFLSLFHEFFYNILIGEPGFKDVYWICVMWIPFSTLIGYFSVIVRYDDRAKEFFWITIGQLTIRLTITITLIVVYDYGILGIFVGQLIGSIIGNIGYLIILGKFIGLQMNRTDLEKCLKYSLPIVPGLLILGLEPNLTRYFIRTGLSEIDVGLFALAIKIVSVFAIVGMALKMTWQPFFFQKVKSNKETINLTVLNIFNFFLIILALLSLVLSLFASEIISLLAPQEYYASYKIVGLLGLSAIIVIISSISSIGINYVNKTILLSRIDFISIIVSLLIIYFFIEIVGLLIVPTAFFISAIIRLSLSLFFTNKFMKIQFPFMNIFGVIMILLIVNIFLIKVNVPAFVKLIFLLMVMSFVYVRRKYIVETINEIKK